MWVETKTVMCAKNKRRAGSALLKIKVFSKISIKFFVVLTINEKFLKLNFFVLGLMKKNPYLLQKTERV